MTRPLTIAAGLAAAALALALLPHGTSAQEAADQQPAETTQTTDDSEAAPAEAAAAEQAPPAPASAPPAAALVGDAENGRLLTYTCQGCHGIVGYKNAYPTYHVPRIGGQSAVYLSNALTEYGKGTRRHPTMQAQAQSFSDQDIADIAAFLSGLTP